MCFRFRRKSKVLTIPSEVLDSQPLVYCEFYKKKKLGQILSVPSGYSAHVYYRRYQYTFPSGDVALTRQTIPNIVNRFDTKAKPAEKVNFDLYYLSTAPRTCDFAFAIKRYIFADKSYDTLKVSGKINYQVTDEADFMSFVRYKYTKPSSERLVSDIEYIFTDDIRTYIQKKAMPPHDTDQYLDALKHRFMRGFTDIGIAILSIDISVSTPAVETSSFFSDVPSHTNMSVFGTEHDRYSPPSASDGDRYSPPNADIADTSADIPVITAHTNADPTDHAHYCPLCETKVVDGSRYCVHCGYKFY